MLNCRTVILRADLQKQYEKLTVPIDVKKADNYLRRQVRRIHVKPHTDSGDGFSLTERAYRYEDHGIYITVKEKRKRIFLPLTDNNRYTRQLYLKLYPEEGSVEIKAPVDVRVRKHEGYTAGVGLAAGMYAMFTTDEGHVYGERLGEYQTELSDWVRSQAMKHKADRRETGRKKYTDIKRRKTQQLHSYINMELNRLIRTEKPEVIYIPKLPRPRKHGGDKAINNSVSMWQRGYIRQRLAQKCGEQSVRVVEVFAKGISRECSRCGADGNKKDGVFLCTSCGYQVQEKQNTARNAKKRGRAAEAGIGTDILTEENE